jgi:hypothetical protein
LSVEITTVTAALAPLSFITGPFSLTRVARRLKRRCLSNAGLRLITVYQLAHGYQ